MENIEVGECQVCHSRCDSRSQCFRTFIEAKMHDDEEKNKELLRIEHAKVERYWDSMEAKMAADARRYNRIFGAALLAIAVLCLVAVIFSCRKSTAAPIIYAHVAAPVSAHASAITSSVSARSW